MNPASELQLDEAGRLLHFLTIDGLSRDMLTEILTYHVVAGNLDSKAVVDAIKAGGGKAKVRTLSGGTLTAMMKDGKVWLKDENGNKAQVTAVDLKGSNGVIHVIDAVVLPKS